MNLDAPPCSLVTTNRNANELAKVGGGERGDAVSGSEGATAGPAGAHLLNNELNN